MFKDPIVEQVRRVRRELDEKYPDSQSLYEHYERVQQAYRERLVRRSPRRPPHAQAS